MDSKILAILVSLIVVGAGSGYGAAHLTYSSKIKGLKTDLNEIEFQYETVSNEFNNISIAFKDLKAERDDLQSQVQTLSSNYNKLQGDYDILSSEYDEASGYLKDLSNDVESIIEVLLSYCNIPEAFQHVLNNEEVEKIFSKVAAITGESEDNWYAYEEIYRHVTYHIETSMDIEFPYVSHYDSEMVDGDEVLKGITIDRKTNYVQTPEFTLKSKMGDIEDKAVLVYAMIKCYERNIYELEYTSYIADIQFSDGSQRLVVFLPVHGGRTRTTQLCILDPDGHYFTNLNGRITQRDVDIELKKYSLKWFSSFGDITNIKLYNIDVGKGEYTLTISGTLEEVAELM